MNEIKKDEGGGREYDCVILSLKGILPTSHLGSITLRDPHHIIASFYLLGDERLRRSKKYNLPTRIPAVKVIHDHSCDKCLPQPSWETDENISEESFLDDIELIISNGVVGRVDP